MPKKITPEEYREIFKSSFPDYELLSDYKGNKEYIVVRCKIDGNVWNTKPNWLKSGAGCSRCYHNRSVNKKTSEEYINNIKNVHGDKYDYSLTEYNGNKEKITVICKKHGKFNIRADHHLQGQGCRECAIEENANNKRSNKDDLVNRANEVHDNIYDYSLVTYKNCDTKVDIICKKHGVFKQTPYVHLIGAGCPCCNVSHLERDMKKFLDSKGIIYQTQKQFPWLGLQSLDFYIPSLKIAIECQGSQHYLYGVSGWGSDKVIDEVIARKKKKKNLCEENNITVFYYSKDKKIFQASEIYTEENTFTSKEKLLKMMKIR